MLGVLIIFLVPVSLLLLAYFGLVPGLSQIVGLNKPKDLGINFSPQDLANADGKILKLSGQELAQFDLDSAEITALMNRDFRSWEYYPIKNPRVKIGADGQIELSGILRLDRLAGFAKSRLYSRPQIEAVLGQLGFPKTNPPIYLKGTLSITNNKAESRLEKVEIGRLILPQILIAQNSDLINSFIENDQIRQRPSLNIKGLNFKNGVMYFDGSYPKK